MDRCASKCIVAAALLGTALVAVPRIARAESALGGGSACSDDELGQIHARSIEACERSAAPRERELCVPTFAIHYDIARCEERAGNVVGAAARYRRFLGEGGSAVSDERREEATKALADAEARIARVTVTSNVATLELRIDGSCAVDETTYDENCTSNANDRVLLVNPGERRLTVKHVGFRDIAHVLRLGPGEQLRVRVNGTTRGEGQVNPYRDAMWTAWGLTGGGAVGTAIVGARTVIAQEGLSSPTGIATLALGAATVVAAGFATYFTVQSSRWTPRTDAVARLLGSGVQF